MRYIVYVLVCICNHAPTPNINGSQIYLQGSQKENESFTHELLQNDILNLWNRSIKTINCDKQWWTCCHQLNSRLDKYDNMVIVHSPSKVNGNSNLPSRNTITPLHFPIRCNQQLKFSVVLCVMLVMISMPELHLSPQDLLTLTWTIQTKGHRDGRKLQLTGHKLYCVLYS